MLTVVVIGKGFGFNKIKSIQSIDHDRVKYVNVAVEEPLDDLAIIRGAEAVEEALLEHSGEQRILLACSRGGKVAAALLRRGWTGATLLISAMSTAECCAVEPSVPLLLLHGRHDKTNPIERVRADVVLGSWCKLVELEEDHSLASLNDGDILVKYIEMAHQHSMKQPALDQPVSTKQVSAARGRVALLAQLKQKK